MLCRYLDQLGSHAASGHVRVFLRQTLLANGGYPLVELAADGRGVGAPHPEWAARQA